MSLNKCSVKTGMKGSSGGRGRYFKTEFLKKASKHLRRENDKKEIQEQK